MLSREAPDGRRPARPATGPLTRFAALALAAGLIAGCGDDDASTATSTAPPAQAGETAVVVTLDRDGRGGEAPVQEVVSCPGPDKAACEKIAALPADPAAEGPPQTACTEIYGGPDTLVLQGRVNGEPVDARLSRANGCEIERFDRFVPLLQVLFPDYEPGEALAP